MRKEEHRIAVKWIVGKALLALLVCAAAGAVITGCRGTGSDEEELGGFRITKFMIDDVEGIINQNARTIEVTMPYGTNVGGLLPKIEFVGANIDPDPAWENPIDFTDPVKYTVFSKDGSAFAYTVTVKVDISNTKEILSFNLDRVTAFSTDIIDYDEDAGVIMVTVPYGTEVNHLTAVITHNGDSINPVAGAPQNFEVPVTYEVYSLQGEKRVYTVYVTIAPNVGNDITRFILDGAEGAISESNIALMMPYGTDTTSLVPDITVSDGATVSPASGTAQNFSRPVTYKVTAEDNTTTRSYTVTVIVSAIDAKDISSFKIAGQEKSEITGNTITVTLPANMPKTNLAPAIGFTGNTVTPASGEERDFTNPVTYTVKAADTSTQTYIVTVTNAPAKNATFLFATANGASWTTETTALTLQFDVDMGSALKVDHITLQGGITKGALTHKSVGVYELAVSDIPDDDVPVSVTIAASEVYGFDITGGVKTTKVFKAPEVVEWKTLTADGVNKLQSTTELTFTFDKDVGLVADDITLGAGMDKGTLSPSGTTRTLTVNEVTVNNVEVIVSLSKTGFAFVPKSLPVTVYKQLSTDATLKSLTVNGYTRSLVPAFSTEEMDYTLTVVSENIKITAEANDANAKLFYVENSNATIDSGTTFNSKTLNEGLNTVTIRVLAEDSTATKSYVLNVMFSDFPVGAVINQTFEVSKTAEWDDAVTFIKGGGNDQNYLIKVTKDFNVAGNIAKTNTFGDVTGLIVVIRGSQTIGMNNRGKLLTAGAKQSVILRDLTLQGRRENSSAVVHVNDGNFEMRGDAKITGNTDVNDLGGGLWVNNGTFTMRDNASVSDNTTNNFGGGVCVGSNSTFTMRDNASVSGNDAGTGGGGVCILSNSSTFRIAGGTVYGLDELSDLKNTTSLYRSAALFQEGDIVEYGTGGTDGDPWERKGTLSNAIDNTIKVVDGVLLQP